MTIKLHNGKPYITLDTDLLTADVPAPAEEAPPELKTPSFVWKGKRLPLVEWRRIVAFFKWTYDTYKAESVVRLYYHPTRHEWKVVVYPQEMKAGLAVKDQLSNLEAGALSAEGWFAWGTGHHHCSAGAFQSGTDATDEATHPGFHFTVGKLDEKAFNYHGRIVYRGSTYEMPIDFLVDCAVIKDFLPTEVACFPDVVKLVTDKLLLSNPEGVAVPDEWKASCIKPAVLETRSIGFRHDDPDRYDEEAWRAHFRNNQSLGQTPLSQTMIPVTTEHLLPPLLPEFCDEIDVEVAEAAEFLFNTMKSYKWPEIGRGRDPNKLPEKLMTAVGDVGDIREWSNLLHYFENWTEFDMVENLRNNPAVPSELVVAFLQDNGWRFERKHEIAEHQTTLRIARRQVLDEGLSLKETVPTT